MAQRDITLRLAVENAERALRDLKQFGDGGDRALKKIETSSQGAGRGLQAVNTGAIALSRTAPQLSSALALLGVGLVGLAAGGVVALAGGLAIGVRNSELAERSFLRLEGVLRATGHSAGLTTGEIADLADEMERTTLASGEAVNDAAAALATFKSISGEIFTETLRLGQDSAATFGGNLVSNVVRFGKALEDPIRGLAQLREVGISFSDAQTEVIKALVETGDVAEAQRKILETLEKQIGGAGTAEAGGLAGAFSAVRAELGDLLQGLAELTRLAPALEAALRGYTAYLSGLSDIVIPDPPLQQLQDLKTQLDELDKSSGLRGEALTALDREDIEKETEALKRLVIVKQGEIVVARMAGEIAQRTAEEERKAAEARKVATEAAEKAEKERQKAADAAAKAAERQAQRISEAIAKVVVEVDQQQRLREALTQSVDAHDEVAKAIEAENAVRGAGLTLQSQEGQHLADLVRARQDEAEAIDQVRLAREREQEVARRRQDQAIGVLAGRERRLDPARAVQDDIDALRDIQAEQEAIANRQAQLVINAADRFSQTVSGTLADFRNGMIDSADEFGARLGDILAGIPEQLIGTAFTGLFDSIIQDFSTALKSASGPGGQLDFAALAQAFNNPLGAATLGALGGGIASQMFGIGGPNSAAFAGLGAGLGFAVGGPIGAAIGGVGGTLLGGIGGSPRDNQGAFLDLSSGSVDLIGKANQNTAAAQQVGQQLAALLQALQGAGVNFDNAGQIKFNVNNERSSQRAVEVAIGQILGAGRTDNALLGTALANTQATSVEGLLGDVQFVRQFELLTQAIAPAEVALRDLNQQFDQAASKARELGLEEGQLSDARTRAVDELVRSTEDQLRGAADSLRSVFDSRIGPLQGSLDQFQFGAGSALGVQTQLGLARSEFDLLAGRAAGGEDVDFNRLASLGTQVVGLARELDASGGIFQQTFADVDSVLRDLLSDQERQRDDLLSAFDALEIGQRDQTTQLSQRLDQLIVEFSQLTRAVELQGRVG